MSRRSGGRRDAADLLLGGVVRLLPAERRPWGMAMRAELAGIGAGPAGIGAGENEPAENEPAENEPGGIGVGGVGPGAGVRGARWSFAVSCVRVVASEPAARRRAGYPLLAAGALTAVAWWSSSIAYAPLRWGLVGLVTVLVAVSAAGRRSGFLGPVGEGRAARLVRSGGYLLVGAMAAEVLADMARHGNPGEQARAGVPIFTVLLAGYLVGFLALTARRSTVGGRGLAAGVGAGVAGAAAWTGIVFAVPPMPASLVPALGFGTLAAILAAAVHRRDTAPARLLVALVAGLVSALLIFMAVVLLARYGPDRLIPDLVPAAISPADDVANSRIEIEDPYIGLLALAFLLAGALGVESVRSRRPDPVRAASAGRGPQAVPAAQARRR